MVVIDRFYCTEIHNTERSKLRTNVWWFLYNNRFNLNRERLQLNFANKIVHMRNIYLYRNVCVYPMMVHCLIRCSMYDISLVTFKLHLEHHTSVNVVDIYRSSWYIEDNLLHWRGLWQSVLNCYIQWNLSITTSSYDTSLSSKTHPGDIGPPGWALEDRELQNEVLPNLRLHQTLH